MEDLQGQLERLLTEAEDCEVIAELAIDPKKRKLFERHAGDLRRLAADIEFIVAACNAVGN
jgi:hypothetical protein